MGKNGSICVAYQYDDMGIMNLRTNVGVVPDESCYLKLASHSGQLFSSMNDGISILCGPNWVLMSGMKRSYGGSICDFSIGYNRLFALHSEENVFDVWETRPSSII